MSSFAQMKSNRQSNIDKITNEVSKLQSPATPQGDDGFWKPEVDKSGNGHAIIRFLPAPEGEDGVGRHGHHGQHGAQLRQVAAPDQPRLPGVL